MKRYLVMFLSVIMFLMFGCQKKDDYNIDYLVLVNKLNPLPETWEENLRTEHFTNSVGDDVEVETKAYQAYLQLKKDLENEGIYVDLDSARRTVNAQQGIMDSFIEKYGEEYAYKTVAVPGYSEHHTGLALDLYLHVDDNIIYENEDLVLYPEIWEVIHSKLPEYGFILRYLQGKEHITGYAYEPWHIRYIDDKQIAKKIMSQGITLEGYLGKVVEEDIIIDLGNSEIFSEDELEQMAILIKCNFAKLKDCQLHSLRYASDEASTDDNLKWINSLDEDSDYVKVAEFLMDFHSPKQDSGSLKPDFEYKDYQYWLGQDENGDFSIVSYGY